MEAKLFTAWVELRVQNGGVRLSMKNLRTRRRDGGRGLKIVDAIVRRVVDRYGPVWHQDHGPSADGARVEQLRSPFEPEVTASPPHVRDLSLNRVRRLLVTHPLDGIAADQAPDTARQDREPGRALRDPVPGTAHRGLAAAAARVRTSSPGCSHGPGGRNGLANRGRRRLVRCDRCFREDGRMLRAVSSGCHATCSTGWNRRRSCLTDGIRTRAGRIGSQKLNSR